ncbi:unnamed protein product [Cyprideis torosa]|uniref:Uncharacterized protein n=1 Tax=Cyprideis torosa TaxID=163714 RepID=A0A7R8WTG8_9CRUS|nr:unnamed protein product [Cyprideis torosa]CAG0906138.1 unnamed protein product [Cyprideis torosa]
MEVAKLVDSILAGESINFQQAMELASGKHDQDLIRGADRLRNILHGNHFSLCSIVNAKSGRQLSSEQLQSFSSHFRDLSENTGLSLCASMGMLTREKACKLREYGVTRYHCNLEASKSYFPRVCTSHSWEEKVETICIAKEAGLDVCSGGIIGMGESMENRVELAFELRSLAISSVPVNILTPIANTPLADLQPLSFIEIMRTLALFRFILPHAVIRLAGGRSSLAERQYQLLDAGVNGAIVGNYLTTHGNALQDDLEAIAGKGFHVQG